MKPRDKFVLVAVSRIGWRTETDVEIDFGDGSPVRVERVDIRGKSIPAEPKRLWVTKRLASECGLIAVDDDRTPEGIARLMHDWSNEYAASVGKAKERIAFDDVGPKARGVYLHVARRLVELFKRPQE